MYAYYVYMSSTKVVENDTEICKYTPWLDHEQSYSMKSGFIHARDLRFADKRIKQQL